MGDGTRDATVAQSDVPDASPRRHPSLGVHLLAGLPTQTVRWGFERARDVMPVVPLDALAEGAVGDANRIGVVLPPFVEPSQVVESWMGSDFLAGRFGRPAHVAGVSTFVDVDRLVEHLASPAPLARHGWGRSFFDRRTVADIVVGQIESSTHLVLVGAAALPDRLSRCLAVLNPGASRIALDGRSSVDLTRLVVAPRADDRGGHGRRGEAGQGHRSDRVGSAAGASAPIVPPWLEVLRGDSDPTPGSGLHVYRRVRPFDPTRLDNWLAQPPAGIVRGKGHVWLANEPDQSVGYSCAGSVHRLFPTGPWWASCGEAAWPTCPTQRQRLLARWHPRFGDRCQELVFVGVDLDADHLCASLDACLVADDALDDAASAARVEGVEPLSTPGTKLH